MHIQCWRMHTNSLRKMISHLPHVHSIIKAQEKLVVNKIIPNQKKQYRKDNLCVITDCVFFFFPNLLFVDSNICSRDVFNFFCTLQKQSVNNYFYRDFDCYFPFLQPWDSQRRIFIKINASRLCGRKSQHCKYHYYVSNITRNMVW